MKIIVCVKVVPEEQDIKITADGALSLERAKATISMYDLNAIEAGAQLVEAHGGTLTAVSVGAGNIDDSKLKKNILSRGPESLVMIADDRLENMDTHQTAQALKAAIAKAGDYDLILCGEGSADVYAQQVGIQLGQMMGIPVINFVNQLVPQDGRLMVERALEDETETLEIPLPAVVSVTSAINLPRIAGMKEILAAGKKPGTVLKATEADIPELTAAIDVISTQAPDRVERKQDIVEGDSDEAIKSFLDKIRDALKE